MQATICRGNGTGWGDAGESYCASQSPLFPYPTSLFLRLTRSASTHLPRDCNLRQKNQSRQSISLHRSVKESIMIISKYTQSWAPAEYDRCFHCGLPVNQLPVICWFGRDRDGCHMIYLHGKCALRLGKQFINTIPHMLPKPRRI